MSWLSVAMYPCVAAASYLLSYLLHAPPPGTRCRALQKMENGICSRCDLDYGHTDPHHVKIPVGREYTTHGAYDVTRDHWWVDQYNTMSAAELDSEDPTGPAQS